MPPDREGPGNHPVIRGVKIGDYIEIDEVEIEGKFSKTAKGWSGGWSFKVKNHPTALNKTLVLVGLIALGLFGGAIYIVNRIIQ